jgi:hypothetical protein
MRIHLFESFIKRLDEISFSKHWKEERGSFDHEKSRISFASNETPEGFEITHVDFTERGKKMRLSYDEIENGILKEEGSKFGIYDVEDLISYGLYKMTQSQVIEKWEGNPNKTYTLDLGKIALKAGDIILTPFFRFESPEGEGGQIRETKNAQRVIGVVTQNMGITFMMIEDSLDVIKRREHAIRSKTKYPYGGTQYPYGKDFILYIDLNLDTIDDVERDIDNQIEQ